MERVDPLELAKRLIRARKAAGLTQVGLAGKADKSPATISGLESGKIVRPHLGTILDLAEALGIEPSELTGDTTAAPKETPPRSMDELLERAGVADKHLAMPMVEIDKAIEELPYEEALKLTHRIVEARRAVMPVLAQYKGTPEEKALTEQAMERNMVAILSFQAVAGSEQSRAVARGDEDRAERIARDRQEVKRLKEVA